MDGGKIALDDKGVHEEAAGRPVCTGAESMEGSSRFLSLWDQEYGPTQVQREVE